ncbi:hypothetical protein EON81_00015 [bacterium]|nr:MAG: hypothetical protein EON81_00015 [bacterium]
MTTTILAAALAVAPILTNVPTQCPATVIVKKAMLEPFAEKLAYSKDPRQYLYKRVVVDVRVHKKDKTDCTCKD